MYEQNLGHLTVIHCRLGNSRCPGGGGLPYKKGGDVRWEISIEPLKVTNLHVA